MKINQNLIKNGLILFAVSLTSSMITIWLYSTKIPPQQVVIRESVPFQKLPIGQQEGNLTMPDNPDFTFAASRVTSSVVNVRTFKGNQSGSPWERRGFGASTGSGVIISKNGYIITNSHVVQNGDKIEVTLSNKKQFTAELIGADKSTDLALIKINADDLNYAVFGDSDALKVGEWVLAVGNPFNLESTVTAGIVSAKGRSIDILEGQDRIESFIQTDAAVNPGNSGGALVNSRGELIGINTAIITKTGRYEGYSFAIPSNLASKVVQDLIEYGIVQRGLLGVFIDEMTSARAQQLGLKDVEGIYISRVSTGSGAEDAGLKRGDVIISVNGYPTPTLPEMQEQIGRQRPGNRVEIGFIRDGEKLNTNVILKNKSNSTTLMSGTDEQFLRELGFELRELTPLEFNRINLKGVKVASIFRGSKIERTNMDPGFVIIKVDDKKVTNLKEIIKALKSNSGQIILEGVYENYSGSYFYTFNLED
jgi:serine protease Do